MMQMMVMDRLIEARARAINSYVFNIVTHENDTKLPLQPDMVPLSRDSRIHMTDNIAVPPASPKARTGNAASRLESVRDSNHTMSENNVRSLFYQDSFTGGDLGTILSGLHGPSVPVSETSFEMQQSQGREECRVDPLQTC
jgi:hypothetical protein